jgi:hypothetical protein
MQFANSETHKRSVLIRGIYEEAARSHSPETAYALFHELGVSREDVHSHAGYVISRDYQIYVENLGKQTAEHAA